jgi:hypothetical protein
LPQTLRCAARAIEMFYGVGLVLKPVPALGVIVAEGVLVAIDIGVVACIGVVPAVNSSPRLIPEPGVAIVGGFLPGLLG